VREPYEPRFSNIPTEIDHWMRIIDDSISARIVEGAASAIDERRDIDLIGRHLLERVDVRHF
jgi:hypothetical protein